MSDLSGNPVYDTPIMRHIAQKSGDLKPALRKVADFILRHPFRAATLNIEDIAQATATSTAAVNRLSNALGMNGFTGLRVALMNNLLSMVSPGDGVYNKVISRPHDGFSLDQQIELSKGNLDNVLLLNSQADFEEIVQRLSQAQRIFIVGFGTSYYMAGMAAYGLTPYCPNINPVSIDDGAKGAAFRLAGIGPGDVLLAIALPPYTRETLRMAQYSSEQGACVLSLTDSPASPLTALSHRSLFISSTHPVLETSKCALVAVIESLVSAVRLRSKASVDEVIRHADEIMAYLTADGGALATPEARLEASEHCEEGLDEKLR